MKIFENIYYYYLRRLIEEMLLRKKGVNFLNECCNLIITELRWYRGLRPYGEDCFFLEVFIHIEYEARLF